MSWQAVAERTVTAMGYELVCAEHTSGGVLRVYIDKVWDFTRVGGEELSPGLRVEGVGVDDCEMVTRQLQRVLEVEQQSYTRLEVSSPGLDRPLKKAADYRRFVGEQIDLTLNLPFMGRKKYRGALLATANGWGLVLEGSDAKSNQNSKLSAPGEREQVLEFELADVREARLVPVLSFKSRRLMPVGPADAHKSAARAAGGWRS